MSIVTNFDFKPILTGQTISLRPLTNDDFDALYAAASDPLIWEQHPSPLRYRRDVFESSFFQGAINSDGALVIVEKTTGTIIGSSRFYEWDPATEEIAIGFTFLTRAHWGGATNHELKSLMLDHAFRWAKVVWFHIGKDNMRSRKAIERIGARYSHTEMKVINGVGKEHVFYRVDATFP